MLLLLTSRQYKHCPAAALSRVPGSMDPGSRSGLAVLSRCGPCGPAGAELGLPGMECSQSNYHRFWLDPCYTGPAPVRLPKDSLL